MTRLRATQRKLLKIMLGVGHGERATAQGDQGWKEGSSCDSTSSTSSTSEGVDGSADGVEEQEEEQEEE